MFTLARDLVVTALEEVEAKGEGHYTLECPRCRHAIKVPRGQLERMRPRGN
jgi:hypothetical protein